MITFTDVLKQENGQTILKAFDLKIERGQSVGIRLTNEESHLLLRLLMGKEFPTSGTIEQLESVLMTDLPDDGLYESMMVKKYLEFFQKLSGFAGDLAGYRTVFSLMDSWYLPIKKLTVDQRKRVVLFRLFILAPDVIFLTNPFLNLSNEGIELYLKALVFLEEQGITFLFTSKYMEDLLLLTTNLYSYHVQNGLQKIELSSDDEAHLLSPKEEAKERHPKTIFKIACKTADKTIFFSPDDIDFIESLNSVSHVRVGEESFPSPLTMNELEERLQKFGFFRCHRSYLVNLQRISELISYSKNSYTLLLKGNQMAKIPLSRSRLEEMRQLLEF